MGRIDAEPQVAADTVPRLERGGGGGGGGGEEGM